MFLDKSDEAKCDFNQTGVCLFISLSMFSFFHNLIAYDTTRRDTVSISASEVFP